MESKNVDTNLHKEDDDEHEDSADGVEGEDHPETLPGSVVVGKDCLHHTEEGDAHRGQYEHLEVDSETVKVVFLDEPIESHQEDTLNH